MRSRGKQKVLSLPLACIEYSIYINHDKLELYGSLILPSTEKVHEPVVGMHVFKF